MIGDWVIFFSKVDLSKLDWGSVPAWFGAIGTMMAVMIALYVSLRDRSARLKSEKRYSAERIAVWKTHPGDRTNESTILISNTSHLPIFDVVLSYGSAYGDGNRFVRGNRGQILLLKVPPGLCKISPRNNPIKRKPKDHLYQGVAISFRDSNGLFWRRDASGRLTQTKKHPFQELGINEPVPKARWASFITLNSDS